MTTDILGITEMTEGQSAKHVTFNEALAAIETGAIVKLADGVTAGMQTADGKTTLFTVPTGYKAVVTMVVVRQPTGSLAGDSTLGFDFGDGANANTWKTGVDLSSLATTEYRVIRNDDTDIVVYDAGDVFGIKPNTGATADVNATIDVFGYAFEV